MIDLNKISNFQIIIGGMSVGVGILLMVPSTYIFKVYEESVISSVFGATNISMETYDLTRWLLGTCGAGIVGWGIMWIMVSHYALRNGEKWAYWSMLISLISWSILDVAIAIRYGVTSEILFVFSMLVFAIVPLMIGKKLYE